MNEESHGSTLLKPWECQDKYRNNSVNRAIANIKMAYLFRLERGAWHVPLVINIYGFL